MNKFLKCCLIPIITEQRHCLILETRESGVDNQKGETQLLPNGIISRSGAKMESCLSPILINKQRAVFSFCYHRSWGRVSRLQSTTIYDPAGEMYNKTRLLPWCSQGTSFTTTNLVLCPNSTNGKESDMSLNVKMFFLRLFSQGISMPLWDKNWIFFETIYIKDDRNRFDILLFENPIFFKCHGMGWTFGSVDFEPQINMINAVRDMSEEAGLLQFCPFSKATQIQDTVLNNLTGQTWECMLPDLFIVYIIWLKWIFNYSNAFSFKRNWVRYEKRTFWYINFQKHYNQVIITEVTSSYSPDWKM